MRKRRPGEAPRVRLPLRLPLGQRKLLGIIVEQKKKNARHFNQSEAIRDAIDQYLGNVKRGSVSVSTQANDNDDTQDEWRTTISMTQEQFEQLDKEGVDRNIDNIWIVRAAIERYIEDHWAMIVHTLENE